MILNQIELHYLKEKLLIFWPGRCQVSLVSNNISVISILMMSLVAQWLSHVWLCSPMDCNPPGSSVHGGSPGQNTGMGCHALLQGIFPTQGLNSGLLHCRQILYSLSHQERLRTLEQVACSFSRGSSWPRDWTQVSCTADRFFTTWATRASIQLLKRMTRTWMLLTKNNESYAVCDIISSPG